MENLNRKKIIIAPFTKTSDAFRKKILSDFPEVEVVGFCDKVQKGNNIYSLEQLKSLQFDFVFILSPNHFQAIYKEYCQQIARKKLYKVIVVNNSYAYLNQYHIALEKIKLSGQKSKNFALQLFNRFLDSVNFNRSYQVFVSKDFIGGNNKFLFLYAQEQEIPSVMLTNNKGQYRELKQKGCQVCQLKSWMAYYYLALGKTIIVDQGDNSALLNLCSEKQKTAQLWHGVPLEHMNLLTDITYDYFVSTSDYVSETSFKQVFLARQFISCGYPRNDVFLKQQHIDSDLFFTDESLYNLVKEKFASKEKIVVYMPTFRESDFGEQKTQFSSMPLDFASLNETLKKMNTYMIIKLHPFVMVFYQDMIQNNPYSHVLFHNIQGDIYPLLKYADILITDYSSVYADFLLLNRPIIFFIYDHGHCSKMAHGYLYEFDEVSPGEKAYTQAELIDCIKKINQGTDSYKQERETLCRQFFDHQDEQSSKRIMEYLN